MAITEIPVELQSITEQYIRLLKKSMVIEKVYLFGSCASGRLSPDSDIDIAVVSPDLTGDPVEDRMVLMRVRRSVDLRIEPHPFTADSFQPDHPLAKEIVVHGIQVA